MFFISSHGDHRPLHSFPTRRSSDLLALQPDANLRLYNPHELPLDATVTCGGAPRTLQVAPHDAIRSEEHTSELQSRLHLVCRLLLEKKKKIKRSNMRTSVIQ